jgi:hypothetical protein
MDGFAGWKAEATERSYRFAYCRSGPVQDADNNDCYLNTAPRLVAIWLNPSSRIPT